MFYFRNNDVDSTREMACNGANWLISSQKVSTCQGDAHMRTRYTQVALPK